MLGKGIEEEGNKFLILISKTEITLRFAIRKELFLYLPFFFSFFILFSVLFSFSKCVNLC